MPCNGLVGGIDGVRGENRGDPWQGGMLTAMCNKGRRAGPSLCQQSARPDQ